MRVLELASQGLSIRKITERLVEGKTRSC
jgi:hypothetical protein